MARWFFLISLMLGLVGCGTPAPVGVTPSAAAPAFPAPTSGPLPPTFTPTAGETAVSQSPTPAAAASAAHTSTPIPFTETIVEFRIRIPALNLDRRLIGNIASQITVVDETSGRAVQRSNQAGPLLELRQALPGLVLEPVPDGCESCVYFEYTLPLVPAAGAGWLRDPLLLASVENFTSVALGPHFPPDTVVGLRRGISPYAPAHSLALTADGRLWRWLATDDDILPPLAPEAVGTLLADTAVALNGQALADSYLVDCVRLPVETLQLNSGESPQTILVRCPALALPPALVPLYQQLDAWLEPFVAAVAIPQPPPAFPLTGWLDYRRPDGSSLALALDGEVSALDSSGTPYTSTLTITEAISLTDGLVASGRLQPGLQTLRIDDGTATAVPNYRLIVRTDMGLLDASYPAGVSLPELLSLDQLLDSLLPAPPATAEPVVPTPTSSP